MHVIVSGAGIAGSALACLLGRSGIRVTVFEKAKALLPYGQNVDLEGTAVRIIEQMGLLEEVRAHNTTEAGTHIVGPSGSPIASFPVAAGDKRSVSLTSPFEILRGDLAAILYRAARLQPSVKFEFGTIIRKVLRNDEATGVSVETSTGEVLDADMLVAADGQWSSLRKQNFPPSSLTVVDTNMYAVYWTAERRPEDTNWWYIYQALKGRIVTLRPDPHGSVRAAITLMPRTPEQKEAWQRATRAPRELQAKLIREEFKDAGWQTPRILDSIDKAEDFYFQAVQQIRLSKWSQRRIVCLGDSAWAPTPLTGAGTSLAITGTYVLAGEITKLAAGEAPSKAFERFEQSFRPFVEQQQWIVPVVPRFAHAMNAWERWAFQTLLWAISRIVALPAVQSRIGATKEHNHEDFKLPEFPMLTKAVASPHS